MSRSRARVARPVAEAGRAADGEAAVPHPVALVARPGMLVVADAEPGLAALGLDDFDALAGCDAGTRIKKSWLREVRRVSAEAALEAPVVYVKRYRAPAWWRACWNRGLWQEWRGALREWRNLWLLRCLGIPTLEPLAYAEGDHDGVRTGVLVTRELADTRDLEHELVELGTPDRAPVRARQRGIAARLALLVRRLHDAGLYHRDLYLGHLRIDPRNDRLFVIDVQRMGPAWMAERGRVKELAQLSYTAYPPFVTRAARLRFLARGYLGVVGPCRAAPLVRRFATRVAARVAWMRCHQARKRVRRVQREGRTVGLYFDRFACRLEWCWDVGGAPTLLAPGGEPVTVELAGARWVAGDRAIELPADAGAPPAGALAGVAARARDGRIARLAIAAQEGFDAHAVWRLARAAGALAF